MESSHVRGDNQGSVEVIQYLCAQTVIFSCLKIIALKPISPVD
jgi:hypothetical protein